MFKNHQIPQLQAKIKRLKREKAQLRAFLHEIIEAHYRVINQEPTEEINPNTLDDNEENEMPDLSKEVNHE